MSAQTIYYVAQSLDGFIADRDDGLEWLLSFGFDDFQQQYDEFFSGVGAGTRVLPHAAASIPWHLESAQPIGSAGAVELRYRARSS